VKRFHGCDRFGDAIEDAGVNDGQIATRFGARVAQIVLDCTDTTGAVQAGGKKEPWLLRKTRYIEHLQSAALDYLLVSAAEKAHNARDMVLDARRDPTMWSKFNGGWRVRPGTCCGCSRPSPIA
jgi:(p)ppGpp synthase/HD superfamily hydrolase